MLLLEADSWKLEAPSDSSFAHCMCVVGKNYRLQDIQLKKNLGEAPAGSVQLSAVRRTASAVSFPPELSIVARPRGQCKPCIPVCPRRGVRAPAEVQRPEAFANRLEFHPVLPRRGVRAAEAQRPEASANREFHPVLPRRGIRAPAEAQRPEAFANQTKWRIPGSNR